MAGGDGQTCLSCHEQVVFITEAFGCICPNCGTVTEDEDFTWASGNLFPSQIASSAFTSSTSHGSTSRISREAKRHVNTLTVHNIHQSKPDQDAIIGGILARFSFGNLQREVQDLIVQVNTLSASHSEDGLYGGMDEEEEDHPAFKSKMMKSKLSLHGDQAMARLAVAATFSILHKHNKGITLEEVWSVSAIGSLDQIAHTLQYLESLLGGTFLLPISREDAHELIPDQITFLIDQSKLQARERSASPIKLQEDESVLGVEEQNFVKEARIELDSFRELAFTLCKLCSDNGLHNRSAKQHGRKDLTICAWAIVIIAMESSSGRICNEGKMAKAIVTYKMWLQSKSHIRLSPEEADVSSRSAMEELVKKRYMEITRMISTYLECLPWLADEIPSSKEKKAQKNSKTNAIPKVKEGVTSIKPFPRKIIAKYLADVIKLRPHIEKKLTAQADSKTPSKTLLWSRFGSTEDIFHSIRRSEEGQKRIKEEQEDESRKARFELTNRTIDSSSQSQLMSAIDGLLDPQEGRSNSIAHSVGSKVLQYESLRDMPNEVVDSLFFLDGEMESYLRSSEEVEVMRTVRQAAGDWDTKTNTIQTTDITTNSSTVKRARTEDIKVPHMINGKRTKALPEVEAKRILSLLL